MQIQGHHHGFAGLTHSAALNTEDKNRENSQLVKSEEANKPSADQTKRDVSLDEQRKLEQLKQRDRQVKAHETAHKAAGGSLTGSIQYEYQTGSDGKRYAVGGEVSIDTSKERTPEATLQKAERIRAAALAPADPSAQDRAVASKAAQMAVEARTELLQQQREQQARIREQQTPGQQNQAQNTSRQNINDTSFDPSVAVKTYSSLESDAGAGDAIDIIA